MVLAGTFLIPPELTVAKLRERMLGQGQVFPPALAERIAAIRVGGAVAAFFFWAIMLAVFAGVVTVFLAFLLLPLRIAAEDAQLLLSLGAFARFLEAGYVLRFLSFFGPFRPVGVAAGGPGSRQDRP